jgi:ankyrin repeat protein
MTPLHFAAAYGHQNVVELLLASKADVNAKDNNGWTPAHTAAAYGHKDLAELLQPHDSQQ